MDDQQKAVLLAAQDRLDDALKAVLSAREERDHVIVDLVTTGGVTPYRVAKTIGLTPAAVYKLIKG